MLKSKPVIKQIKIVVHEVNKNLNQKKTEVNLFIEELSKKKINNSYKKYINVIIEYKIYNSKTNNKRIINKTIKNEYIII